MGSTIKIKSMLIFISALTLIMQGCSNESSQNSRATKRGATTTDGAHSSDVKSENSRSVNGEIKPKASQSTKSNSGSVKSSVSAIVDRSSNIPAQTDNLNEILVVKQEIIPDSLPVDNTPDRSSVENPEIGLPANQPDVPIPVVTTPIEYDYYLYVAASGDNRIRVYDFEPATGAISLLSETNVPGGPGPFSIDSSNNMFYVGSSGNRSMHALSIDPQNGSLAIQQSFNLSYSPVYVHIDIQNAILWGASYGNDLVASYQLNVNRLPKENTEDISNTGDKAHSAFLSPDSNYLIVPNTGASQIQSIPLTNGLANGTPTVSNPTVNNDGPRHAVFHPTLPILYAVNEYAISVTAYTYQAATGNLSLSQSVSASNQNKNQMTSADIHITSNGKFLYSSNRDLSGQGRDSIAMFSVSPQGALTFIGEAAGPAIPREFAIDPTDQFVFALGQNDNRLRAYSIDQLTGALNQVAQYDVGQRPSWVEFFRVEKTP